MDTRKFQEELDKLFNQDEQQVIFDTIVAGLWGDADVDFVNKGRKTTTKRCFLYTPSSCTSVKHYSDYIYGLIWKNIKFKVAHSRSPFFWYGEGWAGDETYSKRDVFAISIEDFDIEWTDLRDYANHCITVALLIRKDKISDRFLDTMTPWQQYVYAMNAVETPEEDFIRITRLTEATREVVDKTPLLPGCTADQVKVRIVAVRMPERRLAVEVDKRV